MIKALKLFWLRHILDRRERQLEHVTRERRLYAAAQRELEIEIYNKTREIQIVARRG